ncbi:hypothetical protein E2C01_000057 [Portunus trituberculatus]|uniref:Uncharacterized protein n=1 Tax=Portunus trituberculatus TaxID=210409 RepID=A0A5B7CDL9_PORTR|nr:hypothetical protein [Portunus trituberculatus]
MLACRWLAGWQQPSVEPSDDHGRPWGSESPSQPPAAGARESILHERKATWNQPTALLTGPRTPQDGPVVYASKVMASAETCG